jgi:GNAT superfamily N-acetyltransferase
MSLRLATLADIDAMHRLRLSVRENALADPRRVVAQHYVPMLEKNGRGWVYELERKIVGFAIADHSRRNIWALFVDPAFEGLGIGRALHDAMVDWLFEQGHEPLWLTTGPDTRAERFYSTAGWRRQGTDANGELRFELTCRGVG